MGLAEELCRRLSSRDLEGRTIGIKVRLDDWTTVTRSHTVEQETNDPAIVVPTALDLLRAYAPPRPVRLLGVRMAGFADESDRGSAGDDRSGEDQLRLGVVGWLRDYRLARIVPTPGNRSRSLVAVVRSKSRPAT